MENGPVRNDAAAVGTLFDLASDPEAGARCEGPGCTNTIPPHTGRGRPRKTCSQSCKSRAARARTDSPRSAAAVPGPAEAPTGGEVPEYDVMSERDNYRRRVAVSADWMRRHADTFLAAVDADPMGAYKELMERVYSVTTQLNMNARHVRDQARWPDLDADERHEARMREDWNLPDDWTLAGGTPIADRSENEDQAAASDPAGDPDRSQNSAASVPGPAAPIADRSEITTGGSGTATHLTSAPGSAPADDGDALLRAALADPQVRFSGPGRVDDLAFTFGEGWELVTWTLLDGSSVRLLRHHGVPVGWTALLPDGRWGLGGWIAVQYQGQGRPGRFVADRFSRPQTYPSADLALDVFHRTTAPATPAPAAAVGAVAADDVSALPDLALGVATARTPPTLHNLGEPHRDYAGGGGLVRLTWPGRSTMQALEQHGRLAGWTEVYDEHGNWATFITGCPVVDAADGVPLLSADPADALTLLRLALGQGLADQVLARRPPRVQG
ncbi:hypothetical protein ACWCYY_40800 [Kitasatospora sp. NPDC001664]